MDQIGTTNELIQLLRERSEQSLLPQDFAGLGQGSRASTLDELAEELRATAVDEHFNPLEAEPDG